jgi:hypothetical protein
MNSSSSGSDVDEMDVQTDDVRECCERFLWLLLGWEFFGLKCSGR